MENTVIYIVLGLVALFLFTTVKTVSETERYATFAGGRFIGFKGPGIVLKTPSAAYVWHLLHIGDVGEMRGPDFVRIDNVDIPARSEDRLRLGAKVSIVGYDEKFVRVEPYADASQVACPSCGHEFQI